MFDLLSTPERLVLRRQHLLPQCGLFLVACVLFWGAWTADRGDLTAQLGMSGTAVAFLVTALVFFPRQVIVFDRSAGLVVNKRDRFVHRSVQSVELEKVKQVAVQSHYGDREPTERLTLLLDHGPLPLEIAFGSGRRGDIAREINEWLQSG